MESGIQIGCNLEPSVEVGKGYEHLGLDFPQIIEMPVVSIVSRLYEINDAPIVHRVTCDATRRNHQAG